MRLKIIDKSPKDESNPNFSQTEKIRTLNQMNVKNLQLNPNGGAGYSIMVEGVMPYHTHEGQLTIDLLTNSETLNFEDVQHCEPVEYTDKYYPSKYGIIFKEKINISPTDSTSVALNVKLLKDGTEFDHIPVEGSDHPYRKLFKLQVLDNDKVVYSQESFN